MIIGTTLRSTLEMTLAAILTIAAMMSIAVMVSVFILLLGAAVMTLVVMAVAA